MLLHSVFAQIGRNITRGFALMAPLPLAVEAERVRRESVDWDAELERLLEAERRGRAGS